MKKYKFIGTESDYLGKVAYGKTYDENLTFENWFEKSVGYYADQHPNEWEEVVDVVGVDPFEAFMEGLIFGLVGEREHPIAVKVLEKYKSYKNV